MKASNSILILIIVGSMIISGCFLNPPQPVCVDEDTDGYGTQESNYCAYSGVDCDDSDADVNPGVGESCGDGVDNNCDGEVDEGCSSDNCFDEDMDGYDGLSVECSSGTDCNDNVASINPGANEDCNNGFDDDCDGDIDNWDVDCAIPQCTDTDKDGYGVLGGDQQCQGTSDDCNDNDANIHPGATEVCSNEIDDDCNGDVDCDDINCVGTLACPTGLLCGNGNLDPGEECDDGNKDNTDACLNICEVADCNDGFMNQGEDGVDCGLVCDNVCATPDVISVYIDADTANEVDDLYAIVGALVSPEFVVEGLSSASYGFVGGNENSQRLNEDILNNMGLINDIDHPLGASGKMSTERTPIDSPAARDIIAKASKHSSNDKLLVLVLGPATNVASALLLAEADNAPIEDKIIVGFMGTTYYNGVIGGASENNYEFNVGNDPNAFESLFDTNVQIRIMPGKPISEQLKFDLSTAKDYLDTKGGVFQYIYDYWKNSGWPTINKEMWDVTIIEATKDPSLATHDIKSYGGRSNIWVYSDVYENDMEKNYWDSITAYQNGGPGADKP